MYHVAFTLKSSNAKTGPIPTTVTTAVTCPKVCPFNHANAGGCYAESGPLAIHWRKVTNGERGESWDALARNISALPADTLWRHNVAGDLPTTDRETIDAAALRELVKANKGRRGFTYTHHDMRKVANRRAVKAANAAGFTVNLSANSPAHADELAALDVGPVVTVLPADAPRKLKTPAGRTIIGCPAETSDKVTCASCGLCQRADRRGIIIGFHAHGSGRRKADAVARGAA